MWKHSRQALAGLGLTMALVLAAAAQGDGAQMAMDMTTVMVGGEAMFPNKNIVANAVNSPDHTTLVAAVKAAGLVETLQGTGPFTVFAPTNAAFDGLPEGTASELTRRGTGGGAPGRAALPVRPGPLPALRSA